MVDEPPHQASTSRAAANAATSRNPNTNPHSPPQVEVDEVPTIPTTRNGRTRTRTKTNSSERTVRPPPPTSKGRNRNKTAAGEMETMRPAIFSPSKKEGKSKRKRGVTPVEVVEAEGSDGDAAPTEKRRKGKGKGKNSTSKEDTTLAKIPSKTAKSKRKVVEEEEDEGDVEEQPSKGTRKKQLRKQDEDVDVKEDLHSVEKTKRKGKVREKEPEMPVEISVKKSGKEKKALEEEEENEQVDRELRKKAKKVSAASDDKETGSKRKRTKGAAGEEEGGPTKRVKSSKLQSDGIEEENVGHKEKVIVTKSAPGPASSKDAANKRKRKIAGVGVELELEPLHSSPPFPVQKNRNLKRKTRDAPNDEEERADQSHPKKAKRSKVDCSPPSEEVSDVDEEEKRLQRQNNIPKAQQVPPVQRAAKKEKKNGKGSESKVVEVESQLAMTKGKKRKEVEDLPKSNPKSKRSKSGLVSDNELETEMAIEEEGSPTSIIAAALTKAFQSHAASLSKPIKTSLQECLTSHILPAITTSFASTGGKATKASLEKTLAELKAENKKLKRQIQEEEVEWANSRKKYQQSRALHEYFEDLEVARLKKKLGYKGKSDEILLHLRA
ncbi:hypothetical protein BT69DRAFT_1322613 [Atractiella rhizophila]|nr:hypothetical protein BT69DRAFT_1322613 [Atractiella rhizophila]